MNLFSNEIIRLDSLLSFFAQTFVTFTRAVVLVLSENFPRVWCPFLTVYVTGLDSLLSPYVKRVRNSFRLQELTPKKTMLEPPPISRLFCSDCPLFLFPPFGCLNSVFDPLGFVFSGRPHIFVSTLAYCAVHFLLSLGL